MRERRTARVLLFDPQGRILLLKGRLPSDPDAPAWWFTVGGGVETGETLEQAARREILEETGFEVAGVSEVLWRAEQVFSDRKGRPILIKEAFMVAHCEGGEPSRAGWVALEREFVDDIRWWSLVDLAQTPDPIHPPDLVRRVADLIPGSGAVHMGQANF